ncbi:MAG: hypothetical protein LBU58_02875 [Clostridiales bacterium]|jgi:hypothetical protein|nr:hypothetical protein [Clostridiales bacterium]
MAVKRSVSGFCPHLKRNTVIAVWFRELKRAGGGKYYEKTDFDCNSGYRSGCDKIASCPVYNDAAFDG